MRRPWTRSTKISLAVWSVAVLLQAGAVGAVYLRYSGPYVTTSNAQVDGNQVRITAPADGTLIKWDIGEGSLVSSGQAVGRIRQNGSGFSQPEMIIRSPGRGRVAVDIVQQGQWVTRGTTLALAFEPTDLYVTARVPTGIISHVHLGAPVDLSIDAYPHATITGVVSEIQSSTAGRFDIYPSPDQNTQNPRRVVEWVPVKITFTTTGGAPILPGLNLTARIHKNWP
jgi:multidrug resistance efflux pump